MESEFKDVLIGRWSVVEIEAEKALEEARSNLGRITLVYSDQLHFDFGAAENGQTA